MKLLFLNTCGSEGTIALADTASAEPARLVTMPGRAASEMLVRALREALAEAGWRTADVEAIGVVTGPGSFTGVRVGLSVAKGIGEAIGAPLVAVSRLELLAAAMRHAGSVCALLDAGRGEFYCARYIDGKTQGERLLALEDAVALAGESDVVAVCEDAVEKAMAERVVAVRVPEPTAADALPIVLRQVERGIFADAAALDANYLRRTDAEIFSSPPRRAGA